MYEEEREMLMAISCLFRDKNYPTEVTFFAKDISEKLWTLKQGEYMQDRRKFDKDYGPKSIGWKLRFFGFRQKEPPI